MSWHFVQRQPLCTRPLGTQPVHTKGTLRQQVIAVISKVYLKKHTSQGRTYILNKKDCKMVKDAVTKKL